MYVYFKLKGAGINTNMYVEAFHNTLKQVYMRGQVSRHVDKCLHLLLWMARDKAFNRLVKLEKGKTTNRLTVIHARHKASLELSSELVAYYIWDKAFDRLVNLMTNCQIQQFGEYFEEQYGTSTEEWASCHRLVRKHKHICTAV